MEKYICVHGHFYQPPRENPWLEAVELQDSALPYHDWNERITAECYAPNAASRILDGERRILDIVSNYAKISFNFGPTLLMWMQTASPETYQAILEADRQSMEWRSGHGAAIAQVYNHMIMPLANTRDKWTQIIWGIKDFEYRFRRFPEGMWLAETAVDIESLELLAEAGIRYTILAPRQAARFRPLGGSEWTELAEQQIDPTRAYLCNLPSKRSIVLYFYDGPISQAVAFENLLQTGEIFAERLLGGFSDQRDWSQLLNIATDGESYGHHHKFGDMALAAALNHIESNNLAKLTNYGEFLDLHPPSCEVEIHERSSWSCAHGVERWQSNCGCNSGGHADWNQEWRAPLRQTLDWLRDRLAEGYEQRGNVYFKDSWKARDAYIDVILDRSEENLNRFLDANTKSGGDDRPVSEILKLLEIQRHTMLMYTSCGWFFDELSGIETVQVMQYAGRTLQLAEGLLGRGLEEAFVRKLATAKSNIPEHADGAAIFSKFVKPAAVDLIKVGVHFSFSSLFKDYDETARIFSYSVTLQRYEKLIADEAALATGIVTVTSEITRGTQLLMFCVVRFGRHDFKGGVCKCSDEASCGTVTDELRTLFEKGYLTEIVSLMDRYFGTHNYSLSHLFKDEQRSILSQILGQTTQEFAEKYQDLYEHNRALMEFVQENGMPVPKAFLAAAELTLNGNIIETLTEEELDGDKMNKIIENMKRWSVDVHSPEIEFNVRRYVEEQMEAFSQDPAEQDMLARVRMVMELGRGTPIPLHLWKVQNIYYRLAKTVYTSLAAEKEGDSSWSGEFRRLGELLSFNPAILPPVNSG